MANIYEAEGREYVPSDEEKSDKPPPVVNKKKRTRRLTTLDSDEDDDQGEESEEFHLSEYVEFLIIIYILGKKKEFNIYFRTMKQISRPYFLYYSRNEVTFLLHLYHISSLGEFYSLLYIIPEHNTIMPWLSLCQG